MYGNIGGESRLDFLVIGPAVNLVARIRWGYLCHVVHSRGTFHAAEGVR
jgi:hypothetical protein